MKSAATRTIASEIACLRSRARGEAVLDIAQHLATRQRASIHAFVLDHSLELLERLQEADRRDLQQVVERLGRVAVAGRQAAGERQVAGEQLVALTLVAGAREARQTQLAGAALDLQVLVVAVGT